VSRIEDIPVRVEFGRPDADQPDTVNRVLQEVHSALANLLETGTRHAIDLRQLPQMSAAVYQELRDALLQGEVTAAIQAQVKIEISETQYSGVWWLRYFNEHDEITTEIIEVAEMPVIMVPHRVDILAGLQRLGMRIHSDAGSAVTNTKVP
jgi:hydrogenase-1 operon protein HyaF